MSVKRRGGEVSEVSGQIPLSVTKWIFGRPLSNQMEKLESIQYSTALAVTGAWKGTSREKLYAELGWETLNLR